jgi:hypothetical protein
VLAVVVPVVVTAVVVGLDVDTVVVGTVVETWVVDVCAVVVVVVLVHDASTMDITSRQVSSIQAPFFIPNSFLLLDDFEELAASQYLFYL